MVSQYAVGAGGGLSPLTPPSVMTRPVPFDVAVTPDGRSVYVTNVAANTVSQFDVDPATGRLSPKAPPTVATGLGPGFIAVASGGDRAYVTNFNSNTISQYTITAGTGALVPKTPANVPTASGPSGIAVRAVASAPTRKEQCKSGAWRTFPALGFKNQGDCVSFVATGGKNPPGHR